MYDISPDVKPRKGYFQVSIVLNEVVPKKVRGLGKWETEAFESMGDAIEGLHREGTGLVKKFKGTRLIEGSEKNDELPVYYVIDTSNRALTMLDVQFHDYTDETVH